MPSAPESKPNSKSELARLRARVAELEALTPTGGADEEKLLWFAQIVESATLPQERAKAHSEPQRFLRLRLSSKKSF